MKAVFCKTKTGNGFKLCVNDKWIYTSKDALMAVINNEANSCVFTPFEE